ncbi:MAG: ethylbenzene dehydrogenase-related protein [Candidatus Kapabacteria bacterium]|nr:ethylbenzene dehydrogenase-related protein [Candidatus Kapabacteria bacterium]
MIKNLSKLASLIAIVILMASCSDNTTTTPIVVDPGTSTSDLLSLKTTTAPTIDGTADASWANCQKLTTEVVVPDPGGNTPISGGNYFKGYLGNSYKVTMRSMYDDNNIYFLAEWNDLTNDQNRNPWYFDATTKKWAQEKRSYVYDATSGAELRKPFYEDKFAMLWNVNNSTAGFNAAGCFQTCHMGLDQATHFNAPALHYTNSATEVIDMWHWKSVRTPGQIDDQYINNDEFGNKAGSPEGGRHSDPATDGYANDNVQLLKVTGGTDSVKVPLYFIPGKTTYTVIMQPDIDASVAKKITAVDENGILTYAGGTIDPNTDTEFQRKGATTGTKCIPSVYVKAPLTGDRGDLIAGWQHSTATGWTLEWKRTLKTASTGKDVQYDIANDYTFGVAVFNNAAIAHAIQSKFTLKFKK